MEWQFILALVLAILIILFPVAYVWYRDVVSIYAAIPKAWERRAARAHKRGKNRDLATIDRRVKSSVLAIGRVMRVVLPVAIAVGFYGFLIWFFLAGFGWKVALALGLSIPAILFLVVAFVWYLNVSGLYQVIRAMQQKRASERRLKRMLRQAMVQMMEEALAEGRPVATDTTPQERLKEGVR